MKLCSFLSSFDPYNKSNYVLIEEVNKKRSLLSLSSLSSSAIELLQKHRAFASNTLFQSFEALNKWYNAQKMVHEWLVEDKYLSLNDMLFLNAILSSDGLMGWRKTPIYTFNNQHPHKDDLESIMQEFYSYLNKSLSGWHSLYTAFICRYWLVSIHPFAQANGRTSQLIADYYLLKNGFFPQVFLKKTEILIAASPKKDFMNPQRAFRKFIQTILNAYNLILQQQYRV
jgi:Fic family protein